MAQYKVPQDVEADDKLLGPFSFRQFVYLMIAGGLIALAVGLFQLFPLLAIIPLPPVLFFGALALPLKKDQPMETYLTALVQYYLKSHKRVWIPGQKETFVEITAPKVVEEPRTRSISGEEATHRLSFLADIVDSEGRSIRGQMNEELVVEANTATDIFENNHFNSLENTIARDENARHQEVIEQMKKTSEKSESMTGLGGATPTISKHSDSLKTDTPKPVAAPSQVEAGRPEEKGSAAIVDPLAPPKSEPVEKSNQIPQPISAKPDIIELANNPDYSVATIAKEANRIKEKEEGEVFVSLH
ncbi:PrgI family protein [Candidatus Saccharibacteria bacterium]|nr:PrgI family protein [Candidatus Saccharibacteria bacterium]